MSLPIYPMEGCCPTPGQIGDATSQTAQVIVGVLQHLTDTLVSMVTAQQTSLVQVTKHITGRITKELKAQTAAIVNVVDTLNNHLEQLLTEQQVSLNMMQSEFQAAMQYLSSQGVAVAGIGQPGTVTALSQFISPVNSPAGSVVAPTESTAVPATSQATTAVLPAGEPQPPTVGPTSPADFFLSSLAQLPVPDVTVNVPPAVLEAWQSLYQYQQQGQAQQHSQQQSQQVGGVSPPVGPQQGMVAAGGVVPPTLGPVVATATGQGQAGQPITIQVYISVSDVVMSAIASQAMSMGGNVAALSTAVGGGGGGGGGGGTAAPDYAQVEAGILSAILASQAGSTSASAGANVVGVAGIGGATVPVVGSGDRGGGGSADVAPTAPTSRGATEASGGPSSVAEILFDVPDPDEPEEM